MPWSASDAQKKTKSANTPAKQKQWAKTANAVLKETKDDTKAILIANASVKKKGNKPQ